MGWLVENTVYLTVVLTVVLALRRLLKNRVPPVCLCFLWLLVPLRFLTPLLPEASFSLFGHLPQAEVAVGELQLTAAVVEQAAQPAKAAPSPLFVIWLAGAAIILGYFATVALRFRRGVHRLPTAQAGDGILEAAKRQMGVRANISVKCGGESPMLAGKNILLPPGYDEKEQYQILLHELCHYRHRDNLWHCLGIFLLCLMWFHPLFWIAFRLFCRDMEAVCDARVIRVTGDRKAYAMLLLKAAAPRSRYIAGASGIQGGKSEVSDRICRMAAGVSLKVGWMAAMALLAGAACAFCLTNGVDAPQPEPGPVSALPDSLKRAVEDAGYRVVNETEAVSWEYRLDGNVIYTDPDTGVRYNAEKIAAQHGQDLSSYYGQVIRAYLYDAADASQPQLSAKHIFLTAVAQDGRTYTAALASDSQKALVKRKIDTFLKEE